MRDSAVEASEGLLQSLNAEGALRGSLVNLHHLHARGNIQVQPSMRALALFLLASRAAAGWQLSVARPVHHRNLNALFRQTTEPCRSNVPNKRCPGILMQARKVSGDAVVRLEARAVSDSLVASGASRAELLEYLAQAGEIIARLPMPPGAQIKRKPGAGPSEFLFTLPKIELFDVFLQPTSETKLMVEKDGSLLGTSDTARLDGSYHVKQLGLNERFTCNVKARFAPARDGRRLEGNAVLIVDVDLKGMPLPFSLIPRQVSASTGSAVLTASLQFVMRDVMQKIVQDFARWHARRPSTIS